LDSYAGKLFVDKNIVLERRTVRYNLEEELWDKFRYIILRNP
jgi:hypothetical protein